MFDKNMAMFIALSAVVIFVSMFIQSIFFPVTPQSEYTEANTPAQNIAQTEESVSNIVIPSESDNDLTEQEYVISTDIVKVTLTNRGGDIIGYELLNHRDGDQGIQMADNISSLNRAFSLSFGGAGSAIINDIFSVQQIDDHTIGFYKKFNINSDGKNQSFTLVKEYSFIPSEYLFKLDIRIVGDTDFSSLSYGNTAYTLRTSPQIGPYYNPGNRYEYRKFMSLSDGKRKDQMLGAGQTKLFEKPYSWTGIAGKYFTILVSPLSPQTVQSVTYSTLIDQGNSYMNAQVFIPRAGITQKETKDTYYIYVGPRTEKNLSVYNNALDNSWNLSSLRLNDSMESSGILFWLEAFLKWCMELIYKITPNWGVTIIILTFILKILMFPLTKKSSMASLNMQALQPQIKEIQDKYKGDPQKLNMEMAKLYKETGYNPLSGCLPLLIQFPIIFAMYNLFNNYFEFRGAMFIPGWIPDLSVGDIVNLGVNIPFLGNQIHLLPIIYLLSQLIFSWITQASTAAMSNTQMKIMMYGMPVFFFFLFYSAPSGLLIYWTVSNLLQLVQQVIINKMMHSKRAEMGITVQKRIVQPARGKKK